MSTIMNYRNNYRWLLAVVLTVAVTGCATPGQRRMALLEKTNAQLTARFNQIAVELDAAGRDQAELDRRLQAVRAEAEVLRAQLKQRLTEPIAPAGWTNIPGGAMIAIEGSVLFVPGNVSIRSEASRTLDAVVNTLQNQYAGKDILVVGHTDDQPIRKSGWEDNLQLSAERALAVVRYLGERGVSLDRIIGGGCGNHRPRTPNNSRASRAANRRVEIFAIEPRS